MASIEALGASVSVLEGLVKERDARITALEVSLEAAEAAAREGAAEGEPATTDAPPKVIRCEDYAPSAYLVPRVSLTFRLDVAVNADGRRVCEIDAALALARNPAAAAAAAVGGEGAAVPPDLVLNAEDLDLLGVDVGGVALEEGRDFIYDKASELLTVKGARLAVAMASSKDEAVTLTSRVRLVPETNLQLQGLFCSGGVLVTQCEAEGFRRMAPCLDRPDVLSVYAVRVEADLAACPVLLSNGNHVSAGLLDDNGTSAGRHFACFEDPWPKPTYLFALVAGKLWALRDAFETRSGRRVALNMYSDDEGAVADLGHAMASVKLAMKWDEQEFGREYDLDAFHVVAVADFNMGAMENKGLNVFNSKLLVCSPRLSSDAILRSVQGIVAHE
jgi:aminopeptidase N